MTSNAFNKKLFGIVSLTIIGLYGCSIDEPPLVYNPNNSANPDPIITSVDPADFALSGYTHVKINGQNFSDITDSIKGNVVFFNNQKAKVLSASNTELIVVAPNMESDAVTIKVVSPGAYKYAEYKPYTVKILSLKINSLEDPDDPNHTPLRGQLINGFDVGPDESLYALSRAGVKGVIAKISSGGTLINSPDFPTQPSIQPSDIKYGPAGYIYWLRGPGNAKIIYKVLPTEGIPQVWATLPQNVQYFDFDKDKNLYTLGKLGMYLVDPSGATSTLVGDYSGFTPKGIKVTDQYVYVLGTTAANVAGVFRSQILTGGSLGTSELIFNWSNAGEFAAYTFTSFIMSEDGDLYLTTTNPTNPILLVKSNGTAETLYPGQLATHSDLTTGTWQLAWGSSRYIYQYRSSTNLIYKIYIGKNSVPYYGRQ